MWYHVFKHLLFVPWVRLFCHPEVIGEQNIPVEGPAILAANHRELADSVVLAASIRRTLVYPAKAELFRGDAGLRSRVVAWFLRSVGQVPMDRSGGRASAAGLEPVLEVLRAGGLVGIFPEGTRSPDGRLHRGHTGVARIALAAGVPVLPVALERMGMRRGPLGIPVVDHPRIVIGEALRLDVGTPGDPTDDAPINDVPVDGAPMNGVPINEAPVDDAPVASAARLRALTDEVMAAIAALSGQERVNVYASRVKGESARPPVAEKPVAQKPVAQKPVAQKPIAQDGGR